MQAPHITAKLASVNGQFGSYMWSLHGKPSSNTLNMHATWEKRTREEISLVTQFLDTDYREFTSRIENTALPLLPRWTPCPPLRSSKETP